MNEREELCKLIQSMSDDGIRTIRQVVDQVVRDELFAMIGTMSGDNVRKLRVQLENILTSEGSGSRVASTSVPTPTVYAAPQQEYQPSQGPAPSPFSSAPAPSPFGVSQPTASVQGPSPFSSAQPQPQAPTPAPAPAPVPEPRPVRAETPREEPRREAPPVRSGPQSNNAIVYASGTDSEMTDRQVERCMATLRLIGAKPIKIFRDNSAEQHEIDNALRHATDPANHITYFCVEERSKIATPTHDAKATEDILASAGVNLLLVEG